MASIRLNKQDKTIKIVHRRDDVKLTKKESNVSLHHSGRVGPKGDKGDAGIGLPDGGTAGQVLEKDGSTPYQVKWADPSTAFGDKNYEQSFTPTNFITVNHNLNKYPSIIVKDSAGDEVEGDVTHVNRNTLTVGFSGSFGGTVSCN